MNEKALKTLEYDKIIAQLAEKATSAPGRSLCLSARPLSDEAEINRLQDETAAALGRIIAKGNISFGSVYDITEDMKRIAIGATLGTGEILALAALLENADAAARYGLSDDEDDKGDALTPLFSSITPLPAVVREIRRCILSEEEIADKASAKLSSIRRGIASSEGRIHGELNKIISSHPTYLQDSIITVRSGHYCIPVKAEYKASVGGIVHDVSSSGSTVFVEPAQVVRLGNEIRALRIDEQKEIDAILARLTQLLADNTLNIKTAHKALTELDFIFARGAYALSMDAMRPTIARNLEINLVNARHPLLDRKKAVPVTIRLGDGFDLLVITGPNTGGKTVALKTAGLLTAMALSGLHVPAGSASRIGLFTEIYADIGDEQSIAQSLSTFSAHMVNIVRILKCADEKSLVLFDELGAGTDPTEGAALAAAILDRLHKSGIRTIATTHYSEIKLYALRTEGVENASCEFDVATLSPTYRLLIGIPGKSNAFAISKKLGLPEEIIESARAHISEAEESFEDLIADLGKQKKELDDELKAAREKAAEAAALKAEYEKKQARLDAQKAKILESARDEGQKYLKEAKEYADRSISYFAKHGGIASGRELEKKRTALRERLAAPAPSAGNEAQKPAPKGRPLKAEELKKGMAVHLNRLDLDAVVESLPDSRGNLFVTVGSMRMKASVPDLSEPQAAPEDPKKQNKAKQRSTASSIRMGKAMSSVSEINLIGKTVDEATPLLEKFIDDAVISGISPVRIIHGKGTGALRDGVHRLLKRNKSVASFRLGEYGEGDAGVTIAELK